MVTPKLSHDDVLGYLGVGSLQILGLFLILDGLFNFLAFVENYAKTVAWALFVSVPLIVVSYVLGLISAKIAEIFYYRSAGSREVREATFLSAAASGNDIVFDSYAQTERHRALLLGSAAACITLGVGALAEIRMMQGFEYVALIGAGLAFFGAFFFPWMARRLDEGCQERIRKWVEKTESADAVAPPNQADRADG